LAKRGTFNKSAGADMPLKFFSIVRAAAAERMTINGSVCQVF
jgi:hypothetical protein